MDSFLSGFASGLWVVPFLVGYRFVKDAFKTPLEVPVDSE